MNPTSLLKKYKEMEIQTSSPEKLILILYNGAIKFLNQAKTKMREENIEESSRLLLKAEKIVRELMFSLDLKRGKFVVHWYNLYGYIYGKLIEANLEKNVEAVDEAISLLTPLRDSWAQIIGLNPTHKERN